MAIIIRECGIVIGLVLAANHVRLLITYRTRVHHHQRRPQRSRIDVGRIGALNLDRRGIGILINLRGRQDLILQDIIIMLNFDFEFLQILLELVNGPEVVVLHHADLLIVLLLALDLHIQHSFDTTDLIGKFENQVLELIRVSARVKGIFLGVV